MVFFAATRTAADLVAADFVAFALDFFLVTARFGAGLAGFDLTLFFATTCLLVGALLAPVDAASTAPLWSANSAANATPRILCLMVGSPVKDCEMFMFEK
ncbi:hypothetical protein [Thauera aromatica]|uniref:hypothetical protein n=1 Tax=Thauera aromatica TaxID=59405 RepID=UPI003182D78D